MFANVPDLDWGAWVLGDAPHVLDMACAEIGHGAEVVSASVSLPREDHALPEVRLVLPNERAHTRIRKTLLENGYTLSLAGQRETASSQRLRCSEAVSLGCGR